MYPSFPKVNKYTGEVSYDMGNYDYPFYPGWNIDISEKRNKILAIADKIKKVGKILLDNGYIDLGSYFYNSKDESILYKDTIGEMSDEDIKSLEDYYNGKSDSNYSKS